MNKKHLFFIGILAVLFFQTTAFSQSFNREKNTLQSLLDKQPDQLFLIKINENFSFADWQDIEVVGHYAKGIAIVRFENAAADLTPVKEWKSYNQTTKYPSAILEWAIQKDNQYHIYIKTIPSIDFENIQQKLQAIGVAINKNDKWKGNHLYDLWIDADQLEIIAQQNWILSMDAVTEMQPLNSVARSMTNARIVQAPITSGGENLNGEGVIIAIGDDGIINHVDLEQRILENFNPSIGSSHSIHVTTTAAGAGIKDELNMGFAPKSLIVNQFFNGVLFYGPQLYEDFNINITNNSYAAVVGNCDFAGLYTSESQALDEMAISTPKLLHIFAAGNDGNRTCPPFATGFATTVGAYQPSKNTLTVANLGKTITWFHPSSSKGPIKDGRIKPEITAIGRGILSGSFNNNYALSTGTSMATPNIVGGAALITEKYKAMHGGSLPDGALLKTLLMNGSMDIYNAGPDFKYGFGLMDVQQSVNMVKNNQFLQDSIMPAATNTYSITVPDNVSKAKFMLYWNDVPAMPTPDDPTLSKLINDLDAQVVNTTGDIISPWVLDPANPDNLAIQGLERTNNVEQVTIDNPAAGTYLFKVNGFSISTASQDFVVAWDFEMDEIKLQYPLGGEALKAGDSMFVFFKAPATTSTFSCLFSIDNGANWTTLSASIGAVNRNYNFRLSTLLSSHQCKIKIIENSSGREVSSATFTVSPRTLITLEADDMQCPGSIAVNWTNVPTANGYAVFIEQDGAMNAIDTVSASESSFTFTGLNPSEMYWVSVAPLFEDQTGLRAIAIKSQPNFGNCVNTALPANDIAVLHITQPTSGRTLSSSSLQSNEIVAVKIQNRGTATLTNIQLAFQINDGAVQTQSFTPNLVASRDTVLYFTDFPSDLSGINDYQIKTFIVSTSGTETYKDNDSTQILIAQVANDPVDIDAGYMENFEAVNVKRYTQAYIGINGADKWDFTKTAGYGRATSYVGGDVSIYGNKSMSLDLWKNTRDEADSSSLNSLILNLNLVANDVNTDEVRADFLYRFSGRPKTQAEQTVYLRGSDISEWIPVLNLDTTYAGMIKPSGDMSLNDYLLANGQTFSTSTQIKIEQKDTSLICAGDYGNGLTIDSFRVYAVSNDLALTNILKPNAQACGLTDKERITVVIKNNVFYDLMNVPVAYQLGSGPIVQEIIPIIPSKSTVEYTFVPMENMEAIAAYNINAWVAYPDDSFTHNDSILNFKIHHQPVVNTYPYLATFEEQDGSFYTNDSSAFEWSTPAINTISTAANGEKAWHTSLIKNDSTKHTSYLYSPCFELSGLDAPMLSFSLSFHATTDDSLAPPTYAYIEYATDGQNWQRLGSNGTGYNWYNRTENYWAATTLPWQNASHELPNGVDMISLRFVFESFPSNANAGMAIDDIHIYEKDKEIATAIFTQTNTINVPANTLTTLETDVKYASIKSTQNLGATTLSHSILAEPILSPGNESILPTTLYLKPGANSNARHQGGFYVPHDVLLRAQNVTDCHACYIPTSIYSLGLSKYAPNNTEELNADLSDNTNGTHTFIPKDSIYFLPYMNGYLVNFQSQDAAEYWFYSGGVEGQDNPWNPSVSLSGEQLNNTNFKLYWHSKVDSFIESYTLERRRLDGGFDPINEQGSGINLIADYAYVDQPDIATDPLIYRLKYRTKKGVTRYTDEIVFPWKKMGTFSLYPNPVQENALTFTWNLEQLEDINYQIIDVQGRVFHNGTLKVEQLIGAHTFEMSRIGLAPGLHILQLEIAKERWSEKFIYIK